MSEEICIRKEQLLAALRRIEVRCYGNMEGTNADEFVYWEESMCAAKLLADRLQVEMDNDKAKVARIAARTK